jgi:N-acetylmuramoyl-L-alanine amidase
MSYVLTIDSGHQSSPNPDTGASGYGLHEEDITLDIAERMKPLLEQSGITVVMTREGDYVEGGDTLNNSLQSRVNISNNANCDFFISLHNNAFNGNAYGSEVHISGTGGRAEKMANLLVPQLAKTFYNRGLKVSPNLFVLKYTDAPACLCEVGFIDNENDNTKLADANVRQQIAGNLVQGICAYFGLTFSKPSQQPVQTQEVIKVSERTGSNRVTPQGNNITPLNGGGWIESLPDRLIIHYNEYRYITIGLDGCWVYTPDGSCQFSK